MNRFRIRSYADYQMPKCITTCSTVKCRVGLATIYFRHFLLGSEENVIYKGIKMQTRVAMGYLANVGPFIARKQWTDMYPLRISANPVTLPEHLIPIRKNIC